MSSDLTRPRTAVPDAYGERDLWIGPCRGDNPSPGHVEIYASQVWCGDRVTLISAMHEAAGLPAPVILDRPAIDGEPVCWYVPGGLSVRGDDAHAEITRRGGRIGIGLSEALDLDPVQAREFAALVAACADAAGSEPDPAEVEKLTAEIRTAPGMEGIATADVIARHILRAYRLEMRDRRD